MNHFEWSWQQEGYKLFAQGWTPPQTKAVICLVHGFGEHSGRYTDFAKNMNENGIAVLAIDQFGHGKTDGPRGFSPSLEASMDSIRILLEEANTRFPDVPKFLFGHSMGGNMMLNFLLRKKPNVAGAIASAPWMRLGFKPPMIKILLAKTMKGIYPKWPEAANLDTSMLSRDKEEVRKYETDPLVHNTARAGTFFDTYSAGEWLLENAAELNVSLLLYHGTKDGLIAFSGSEDFVKNAPKDKLTFVPFEGYYHELHNEPQAERKLVYATIVDWINTKI